MSSETVTIRISLPADWLAAFQSAADGVPLSEWLREAAAEKLPAKVRKSLSEARPAHRPSKKTA